MDQFGKGSEDGEDSFTPRQQTSMSTLISWNIAKAIAANPNINLKSAIKATQENLENDSHAVNVVMSQSPEEQYLACALLAWQQLGHKDAESLYQFVESKQNQCSEHDKTPRTQDKPVTRRPVLSPGSFISYEESKLFYEGLGSSELDTQSIMGPVVKLPVDTKIVMRVENTPCHRHTKKSPAPPKELMDKIDAACCMESACIEKLTHLDKSTTDLRQRAQRLARREAERVELLERAEAAWKDLELGYQRRLTMAVEKEEDMAKHIKKLIEERTNYKNACTRLAQQLRERGEVTEKERAKLTEVEKEVCENACMRLRVSEEAAHLDAALTEQHCKLTQLERDLQFKEEQIRRNLQNKESELDSARCLTHEAERALHAELSALRQQITKVSKQLLDEDALNEKIRSELELLRQDKMGMISDLDGCKEICDSRIQDKMDALKKKREQVKELKERVMECQCKLPIDVSVEAKRTPSLAALCKCAPEDKYLDSCSCTSLRSALLSNLLADLFGGLQSELGGCGSQMPCQLLKCLEDRHNWDKTSIVKTNLRNYFSQLLIGELDIAIATSIEKYHAKWIGASCADAARIIPDHGGPETEGWQERALERRAQKLATKLAEQLFKEREEQLTAKAKEIVRTGPPPCECKPRPAAVYPVLVNQPMIGGPAPGTTTTPATSTYWRRTHNDVTQLKVQLEDLKKDSIRKEDLKLMEENIVKIVQRATIIEDFDMETVAENVKERRNKKETSTNRSVNTDQGYKPSQRLGSIKKKQSELNSKKGNKSLILGFPIDKPATSYKKLGRSFAVNLCLCKSQKDTKKILAGKNTITNSQQNKKYLKTIPNIISQIASVKQNNINSFQKTSPESKSGNRSKITVHPPCRSDIMCFHKPPSNTSLDKLLETLAKWQCDLCKLDSKRKRNQSKINSNKIITVASDIIQKNTSDKKSYGKLETKLSKNLSAFPYRSNIIVANVSKCIEVPSGIPINTESEYMGAINLDTGSGNREQCDAQNSSILKCIHSTDCACKKSLNKNKHRTCETTQNTNNKSLNKRNLPNNIQISKNKKEDNIQCENTQEPDIEPIVTPAKPGDCQYCIKFLGVTLTNANPNKIVPDKERRPKNNRTLPLETNYKQKYNHPQVWYNSKDNHAVNKHYTQPLCDCSSKYEEVKNVLNNKHGDYNKNDDKCMDTQSLKSDAESEGCVCCDKKIDESKELEVNAFQLLQEHLRGKLEEFKSATCKSSCISPEEEEKLFSTILQKVKQVITESTGGINCKCASEEPIQGSWHRAYMLLEEYLKIKIQRAQCSCLPIDDANKTLLPDVLEKVCMLIDNDFNRLKKKCTCKGNLLGDKVFGYQNDLPEKDINNATKSDFLNSFTSNDHMDENYAFQSTNNLTSNDNVDETNICNELPPYTDKIDKEISNNSTQINVTQNMSSQITPNLDVETKSCDALKIDTRSEQTSQIFARKYCKITEINFDNGVCIESTKVSKLFGKNNVLVNQCMNVQKELENSFAKDFVDVKPTRASEPIVGICETSISVQKELDDTLVNFVDAKQTRTPDSVGKICDSFVSVSNEQIIDKNLAKNDRVGKKEMQHKIPYIGYTVDCSCDRALGTCTCPKTMCSEQKDNINSIWNTLTSNKLRHSNIAYIMDSVGKTKLDNKVDIIEVDYTQIERKATCDSKTGALYLDEIVLKDSKEKLNKSYISTTTSGDDICFSSDLPNEWCENNNSMKPRLLNTNDSQNVCAGSLYYPVRNLMNRGKSTSHIRSDPINLPNTFSSNCDCNMVPMCHVKMLVENIENKLIHSQCTCDSLSSKVCPVHSKEH